MSKVLAQLYAINMALGFFFKLHLIDLLPYLEQSSPGVLQLNVLFLSQNTSLSKVKGVSLDKRPPEDGMASRNTYLLSHQLVRALKYFKFPAPAALG